MLMDVWKNINIMPKTAATADVATAASWYVNTTAKLE